MIPAMEIQMKECVRIVWMIGMVTMKIMKYKAKVTLSRILFTLGDISCRLHLYSLYLKLMKWSSELDKKGEVWKQ